MDNADRSAATVRKTSRIACRIDQPLREHQRFSPGHDIGERHHRGASRAAKPNLTIPVKSIAALRIVLIALGVTALACQGITYTSRETIVDVGPLHATAEREKTMPLPPVARNRDARRRNRARACGCSQARVDDALSLLQSAGRACRNAAVMQRRDRVAPARAGERSWDLATLEAAALLRTTALNSAKLHDGLRHAGFRSKLRLN